MKGAWVLLIGMILLSGCVQQFVCSNGMVVQSADQCPREELQKPAETPQEPVVEDVPEVQEETPDVPETEEEEPVEEVPEESSMGLEKQVHEMMTNAYNRIESYTFLYVGPPEDTPQDIYYVMGDQVKILVMKETNHKLTQPYTHIILDLGEKTARAVCEATEVGRCEEGFKDLGPVPYDEWKVKLPMDWLDEIEGAEYMGKGPRFEDRETEKIRFETEDAGGVIHLIKFYYMPVRVILDDGTEYEYRDISMNTLTKRDVTANI